MSSTPNERSLENLALPGEVEGFTKRRVELVQRAVKEWTSPLIDIGGRNNLLRYRDLKQGTLDLTAATPSIGHGIAAGQGSQDVGALPQRGGARSDPAPNPDHQQQGPRRVVRAFHSGDPRVIIVVGKVEARSDHRGRVLRELNRSLHRVQIVPYDILGKRASAVLATSTGT